jgi:outer membrane protein OmpA-like peptidoglycan-associated protein
MRRNVQILCIAAAAVVAGGTLWAIAGSDVLGRLGLTAPAPTTAASTDQKGAGAPSRSGDMLAALPAPKPPATAPARRTIEAVAIEIARIEAGGASVIAGRSPPNHRIVVLANGREIASTVASDEGQWSVIVSEGIAAGPLELSVSAKPASGGSAVVSTPRQLVVPPSQQPSRVAEAPPAKVWAPPMAAGGPASTPAPGKVAVTPAARPQLQAQPPSQAESRTKGASDKQALEQFAAIVERARSDAAAASKRDNLGASAPGATQSPGPAPGPGATAARPTTPAPATVAAAAAAPATAAPARATDALPDPAQVPIPVPITFVTDEAELTPDGVRAAALLAEYLRLKRPEGISLSGHADSRGPDGYNMELSKRRLEAIERYLRQAGYAGNLSLTPMGKREPYQGVDRTKLSLQEIYQADRRVELRLTR